MSNKQEIVFIIKPDGSVEEEVNGVVGPDCEAITGAIEDALGQVSGRERKGGYFQQQSESDTLGVTQA